MTSENKSWEMWNTKDLPNFNFPIENENEASNRKIADLLKTKNVDGVLVKLAFLKPGTTTATTTMELVKYEVKSLDRRTIRRELPKIFTC